MQKSSKKFSNLKKKEIKKSKNKPKISLENGELSRKKKNFKVIKKILKVMTIVILQKE